LDCLRRTTVLADCYITESDLRWPQDPHGDGLRRLRANGFDFSKPTLIDFKVYFEAWPAHKDAMLRLIREYTSVSSCGTDDELGGYLEFQVYALLTYELVTNTMAYVSDLMSPYRGSCLSWGVEFARHQQAEVFAPDPLGGDELIYAI
jgi:Regulator of ribonuclease activity B